MRFARILALVPLAFVLPTHADDLYRFQVTMNGRTTNFGFQTTQDTVDAFSSNKLSRYVQGYTGAEAVDIALDYRGLQIQTAFPNAFGGAANYTEQRCAIPSLGIDQRFTGTDRDDSAARLFDYLKSGDLLGLISKRLVAVSPFDPIAGNPNSMMSQVVANDFAGGMADPGGRNVPAQAGKETNPNLIGLGLRFGQYRQADVAVTPWSADNVQHALREDETMIEYYYSDKVFAAFVADRRSVRVVMLDGRGLEQDVQALRTILADTTQLVGAAALRQQLDAAYLPRAQALYRRLLAPILPQVHTPNLLVVAHGVLHYLPFAALHDGRQYVIERFGMRTLPSASVLRFVRDGTPGIPKSLLVFGNPDLGNQRYDLPQAEQEARHIAATVPDTRLLLRGQATRDAFRKLAPDYRYIHFASHGEFDLRQPLRSGLLLSGPDLEQGRLTAAEIYGAHLNAELVTLSGCETGLGTVEGGDDVVGLIRGFMYAGANSVIASLWEVDDTSTSALMTSLYAKLGSLSKRDALRRAQLETMKTFPHPFHWAAFYLTGGT